MINIKVDKDKKQNVIYNFVALGLKNTLPFAIWSEPQTTEYSAILSSQVPILQSLIIETSSPGFAISPFASNDNSFFLSSDFFYSTKSELLSLNHRQFSENDFLNVDEDIELLDYNGYLQNSTSYEQIVTTAIKEIQSGQLKKVVIAREEIIDTRRIDVVEIVYALRNEYPNAFISLIFLPSYGLWIGASPELLLEVSKDQIFRTVALAGTQINFTSSDTLNVSWTQKEIEEQALVNRYIINCFKHLRLREYEDEGPRTIRAGNLLHLRTDFSVDMKKVNMPLLGSQMLSLLHPTSAVAGMPKDEALKFIQQNESLNRRLFSGYLGPVNIEGKTSLFVNLRCANIYKSNAVLYAGAGITQDSVPEKELLETSLKMNTVGKFLRKISVLSQKI